RRLAVGVGILVIESRKELGRCPRLPLRRRPVDLVGSLAVIPAGIRLNDAGIDGEAFALDQTSIHAGPHHRLQHLAQDIAVAKAAVAIAGESQMVRYWVIESEPAEPSVGEV